MNNTAKILPIMAVRKPENRGWQVDFQIKGKRYRMTSPLDTKAGAEALEAQMRQTLAQTGTLDHFLAPPEERSAPQTPTFVSFADKWMTAYVIINNKPSEQRAKRRIVAGSLIPFFGKKRLDEIKTTDIESYKAKEMQRGISSKTINNRLAVLRKCLITAVEWEELDHIPKIQLLKTTPAKFRYLNEQEIQAIVKASETPIERAMVLTAARTGLRFSELRALEWGDIDFVRRILTIRRCAVGKDVGTPKNGRIRHVPLTDDAIAALQDIKNGTGLIFPFDGKMFVYWTSLCRLQNACKQVGIEPIGWHVLRHTFASQLVSRGASLKAVQDLLGHSTVNMTQRYAHLAPEVLRDVISLLEPKKSEFRDSMSTTCLQEINRSPEVLEKLLSSISISSPK